MGLLSSTASSVSDQCGSSTSHIPYRRITDHCAGHQALVAAKNKLQAKVVKELRKVENRLRAARLAVARSSVPATMANQQPLPAFVAPTAPVAVTPLAPAFVLPFSLGVPLSTVPGLELGQEDEKMGDEDEEDDEML